MRTWLIGLSIALTSCSSISVSGFNQHVTALMGRPIQAAFDDLGYPDRQDEINGSKVYYWGSDHSACSFKIVADAQGIARTWDGIGSPAGCNMYLRRPR